QPIPRVGEPGQGAQFFPRFDLAARIPEDDHPGTSEPLAGKPHTEADPTIALRHPVSGTKLNIRRFRTIRSMSQRAGSARSSRSQASPRGATWISMKSSGGSTRRSSDTYIG